MAIAGDSFVVTLGNTHVGWGTRRYTGSRDRIQGECYIPIPASNARSFHIYNSNYGSTGLGYNEFFATSVDGYFSGRLKASGCSKAGDIYAKNLHGSGDLKALAGWFNHVGMQTGDRVRVNWVSPTEITLEKL